MVSRVLHPRRISGKREFEVFARRYLDGLGLRIEPEAGATDILFERSGGNLYVLRFMLWVAFDRWASDEGRGRVLRITDLPDRPWRARSPGTITCGPTWSG